MRTVSPVSWFAMLMLGTAAWHPAAASTLASPGQVATQPHYVDGIGQSVDSALLAKSSGGTDVTEQITLNGTVSNNTSDDVVTGSNLIGSGAFNGATGLPMVIQNTGNGVLIQNATIINVQFQP